VKGDYNIGIGLLECLNKLGMIDFASLEGMFSRSYEDLLLIAFLSNLIKTQISISNKISTLV
jgi:hypothetical protein